LVILDLPDRGWTKCELWRILPERSFVRMNAMVCSAVRPDSKKVAITVKRAPGESGALHLAPCTLSLGGWGIRHPTSRCALRLDTSSIQRRATRIGWEGSW
jgi:hypothetical protein